MDLSLFPSTGDTMVGTIDIWWVVHDGGMLILLAFLLQRDKVWRRCKLRVFTVAETDDNSLEIERDLAQFMYSLRIDAEVIVIEMVDEDISIYTVERTIAMERRQIAIERARLSRQQRSRIPDTIFDRKYHNRGEAELETDVDQVSDVHVMSNID